MFKENLKVTLRMNITEKVALLQLENHLDREQNAEICEADSELVTLIDSVAY